MKLKLKDNTELQILSAESMNKIVLEPMSLESLNSMLAKITPENISYVEFYNDEAVKIGETKKLKIIEGTINITPEGDSYKAFLKFGEKSNDDLRFESLEDTVDKLVAQSLLGGM